MALLVSGDAHSEAIKEEVFTKHHVHQAADQ